MPISQQRVRSTCCGKLSNSVYTFPDLPDNQPAVIALKMQRPICAEIECLWPLDADLGEGLAYEPATTRVWFVDIKTSRLFSFGLSDGSRKSWRLPAQVSALAIPTENWTSPLVGDAILLGVGKNGYCWIVVRGEEALIKGIADPEANMPGNRFNDGKLGPDGRFYAGTMDDSETSVTGAFYALDCHGEITRLDDCFAVTNGPAFSPDGRTLYENDSALRRTYAYDLSKNGQVSAKRLFREFSQSDGHPDGMTTDRDGNLWIAMWDGHKIQKIDGNGNLAGFIKTPVQRPTNCVFVGDNELIFTSAAIGLPANSAKNGGLFRVRLGRESDFGMASNS